MHGHPREEVLSPDWPHLEALKAVHPIHPAIAEICSSLQAQHPHRAGNLANGIDYLGSRRGSRGSRRSSRRLHGQGLLVGRSFRLLHLRQRFLAVLRRFVHQNPRETSAFRPGMDSASREAVGLCRLHLTWRMFSFFHNGIDSPSCACIPQNTRELWRLNQDSALLRRLLPIYTS